MKKMSFTERKEVFQKIAQESIPMLKAMPYKAPQLIEGENIYQLLVDQLLIQNCKRPVIITDEVILKLGLLNDLVKCIQAQDMTLGVFSEIESDPSFETIEKGKNFCINHQFDAVIAFGGGSVMDASKVINVAAKQQKDPKEFDGLFKVTEKGYPLACIPTTAGTGSEVTIFAVITDKQVNRKAAIVDVAIVPDYAVLNPKLIIGLPSEISAATGADALTHAIEAYVSLASTNATNTDATKAIELGFEALQKTVSEPDNLFYRRQMLKASYYAGLSFTKAGLGWVHGIAHQLGAIYHIPHGVAIGTVLPSIVQFYIDTIPEKIAHLGRVVGVASIDDSDIVSANKFHTALKQMFLEIGIPSKVKELEEKEISTISIRAIEEVYNTGTTVPKYFKSQEELEELLRTFLDE
ncbi:iron-containing alcohol dehydrogenase [Flammeovirga kamogawensis]|uniref:Iron-containing alcohol dehydrogenase n=1 Tax=Flammeovirga kamogawensis TaxID=373891 RepID=A0ABX8H0W9_9BACT|nr:iron-containing alcohol dehydrogenase [Flammeovirga kamogawensis]MBB6462423.1 alcohol dehydrogenase class IV [Flammeovirga kamogawensis]QWG09534.1 iron-containing alcohol dehydrogenase [Flammeovirga kamogawensis]TRX65050.1 iron-containing alcohol dehydrogenase [Flammeovirga kamogawensis]